MNESDYLRLAAGCDRLLAAKHGDRARLAIGMLHVIHEHPSWLAQYRRLLDPTLTPLRERALPRGARDLLRMARGFRGALGARVDPAPPRDGALLDVLVVSHLNDSQQLARQDDFYFGAMPAMLRERGAKTLVALVDHRGGAETRGPVDALPERILLPQYLPTAGEMALWRQCAATRADLTRESRAARDPFDRALARLAAEQALAAGTAANLRLYARVLELCSALRPRIVLTTFEGDASERMVFLAARHAAATTLRVGYQHTRLLPRAHAIRRALATPALPCDPDVVLTLGAATQAMLESANPGGVRYIIYGSHRRTAPAVPPAARTRAARCLVLPDAEPAEHAMLFNFTLECARQLPDITFVFRPHPVSGTTLRRVGRAPVDELPANLSVDASESLHAQAAGVRCCLYRASSAVFHAVLGGARPLYVARPREIPIDPLAALPSGRTVVTTPGEVAALARESAWPGSDAAACAWSYCDRYVAPLRPSALDDLLRLQRHDD